MYVISLLGAHTTPDPSPSELHGSDTRHFHWHWRVCKPLPRTMEFSSVYYKTVTFGRAQQKLAGQGDWVPLNGGNWLEAPVPQVPASFLSPRAGFPIPGSSSSASCLLSLCSSQLCLFAKTHPREDKLEAVDAAAVADGKLVKPLGGDLGLDHVFLDVTENLRIIAENRHPPSNPLPMQKRVNNSNFFLAS